MDRTEAIDRLLRHEAELKGLGVKRLFLFGSTAREEAGPNSDVDLFFDYERGAFGLYGLMDVRDGVAGAGTTVGLRPPFMPAPGAPSNG